MGQPATGDIKPVASLEDMAEAEAVNPVAAEVAVTEIAPDDVTPVTQAEIIAQGEIGVIKQEEKKD